MDQPQPLEGLGIAEKGEITGESAQDQQPAPGGEAVVEADGREAEDDRRAAQLHEGIQGGRCVAVLPPAAEGIVGGVADADEQAAGDACPRGLPGQTAAGKADHARTGQGQGDDAALAAGDGLVEQKTGKHGHPHRRRVEQDHGHGRAAEFDGIQGGRVEDAHCPETENGEQRRVAQRDAICRRRLAWVMKQAAPMAARQKAVSSGLTPAARQFWRSGR